MVKNYFFRLFISCHWLQRLLLSLVAILLFLVALSVLLAVTQYHLYQLKQNLIYRQNIINQYNTRIMNKLSKEELITTIKIFKKALRPITFIELQNRLVAITQRSGMTLKQISLSKNNRKSGWKVQVSGQYKQFVLLLSEFHKSSVPAVIQNIEAKVEFEQLLFSVFITTR